eukprot:TRINITY_DN22973_c0_g1_i2.p1 TRINITY_DN22973_c0_g1~~TRINITY_DN22973_c0_g1_i2.p1  ORF type:complete len:275 (+),score=36.70 TRINITY_DN22973_c0_g1_i2:218-1042(+)
MRRFGELSFSCQGTVITAGEIVEKKPFWRGPLDQLVEHFSRGQPEFEYIDNDMKSLSSSACEPLPFASLSAAFSSPLPFSNDGLHGLPFARASPLKNSQSGRSGASSRAAKKTEYYGVVKVTGDGRCMFRALVRGMALNKGEELGGFEETDEADQLRMAVADALCRNDARRVKYEEALIAITVDESLNRYCERVQRSDFWGGEAELLVLSRMCSQPITVYIPESLATYGSSKWSTGFIPIQEYGSEFVKGNKERKGRAPVRLLFNGSNHYDLLV